MRAGWIVAVLACAGSAAATDWYLDAAATGANDGTSWADAWETVGDVTWTSGGIGVCDTLWIQGGEYGALQIYGGGDSGITVRIAADAIEQARFSGDTTEILDFDNSMIDGWLGATQMFFFGGITQAAASVEACISMKWCQGSTIRGVEVGRPLLFDADAAAVNAILLSNSSAPANDQITIEYCYLHDLTGDAVNINTAGPGTGFDRYTVRNTTIRKTGDDGVQASGNITVEDCVIDHADGGSLFGGHPDGVQTAIGAQYIRLRRNRVTGYTQNLFVEAAAGHVELLHNLLLSSGATNSSERGMALGFNTQSFSGQAVIAHNTLSGYITYYGMTGATVGGLASNQADTVYFGNNIFHNCRYVFNSPSVIGDDNIYWDDPDVQFYNTDGGAVSPPGDREIGSAVYTNPLFVASSNFRLQAGSPAIDAGSDFSAWVTTDILGTSVPRGAAPDIGAYEFGAIRTAPDDPPLRLWLGVPQ